MLSVTFCFIFYLLYILEEHVCVCAHLRPYLIIEGFQSFSLCFLLRTTIRARPIKDLFRRAIILWRHQLGAELTDGWNRIFHKRRRVENKKWMFSPPQPGTFWCHLARKPSPRKRHVVSNIYDSRQPIWHGWSWGLAVVVPCLESGLRLRGGDMAASRLPSHSMFPLKTFILG